MRHRGLLSYLSLEAIGGTKESHVVMVIAVGDQAVIVFDLLYGERRISRQSLSAAWAARRNIVLLVER